MDSEHTHMSGKVSFSRYQLGEELGRGGMGVVHRAVDKESGQTVAIKIATHAPDAAAAERFLREARHAVAVRHANVCAVIGTGRTPDGNLFLVMEMVDGPRLLDVARERRAAPMLWLEVLRALAAGIQAVHDKDIVHRDVKPPNVMFTKDGTLKLLDFGIARSAHDETVTSTGMVVGTAAYMSPEQARAEPIDHRSDLFSAGLTAMALASRGATRFHATKLDGVQRVLAAGMFAPPLLGTYDGAAPPELEDLFAGVFTINPKDRVQSAAALIKLIDECPVRYRDGETLLKRWIRREVDDAVPLKLDAMRELSRARHLPNDLESNAARSLALRRASLLDPSEENIRALATESVRGNFRFDEEFESRVQQKLARADLQRVDPADLLRGYELFTRTGHIEIATRVLWAYVRARPDDKKMMRQLERNLFGFNAEKSASAANITAGIKTGGLKLVEKMAVARAQDLAANTVTLAASGAYAQEQRHAIVEHVDDDAEIETGDDRTRPMRAEKSKERTGASQAAPRVARVIAPDAIAHTKARVAVAADDGGTARWLGRLLVVSAALVVVLLLVMVVKSTRGEVEKSNEKVAQAEIGTEVDAREKLIDTAETQLASGDALSAVDAATRALDMSLSVESGLRALYVRGRAYAQLGDRAAARRDLELYLERATNFRDPNIPLVKRLLSDVNASAPAPGPGGVTKKLE